ncbi:DUF4489 domain-containing protein [Clostridium ihumii]|uniref:DUF4489 domain-containing protein n=1 Tax=Clostridium ihumii TaxID=1470356 RepID=UPI00054FE125|nr:DUF4489 domain-containing protein [Clostridium ihumii]
MNSNYLLACNTGSEISIPIPSRINPTFNPIPIVICKLDTSCLYSPTISIYFNANINYKVVPSSSLLNDPFIITFQLSKICNNTSKIVLSSFNYSYGTTSATNVTDSFSFNYYEKNTFSMSSVYLVEIIRVTRMSPSTTLGEESSIMNSFISVNALEKTL